MYDFLISKFNGKRRANMNRLMSRFECYHIKHRNIIGMFWYFFYSIAAYMINCNLDFYQNFFRLRLI